MASICIPAKLKTTPRNHYGSLFRKKGFDSALNGGRGSPWVIEFSVQRYDRLILLLYNGSTWWRSDSGGVQRIVTLRLVPYCLFVTGNFMCIVSYKNNSHCIWFISSLQLKKRSIFLCVVQEVSRDWSDMWSGRGYHRNIFLWLDEATRQDEYMRAPECSCGNRWRHHHGKFSAWMRSPCGRASWGHSRSSALSFQVWNVLV